MTLINRLAKNNNLAEEMITVLSHNKIPSNNPKDFVAFSGFDKETKNKTAFLELSKDPDVAKIQMDFVKNKANHFFLKKSLYYFIEINKKLNREFDTSLVDGESWTMVYLDKPDNILLKYFFSEEFKKIALSRGHFSAVTKRGEYFLFTTKMPDSSQEKDKFSKFSDTKPNFKTVDDGVNPKEIKGDLYFRKAAIKNLHKIFQCKKTLYGSKRK